MDDRWFPDGQPNERRPHDIRANAGEVMPSPVSPVGRNLIGQAIVDVDRSSGRVTIEELS